MLRPLGWLLATTLIAGSGLGIASPPGAQGWFRLLAVAAALAAAFAWRLARTTPPELGAPPALDTGLALGLSARFRLPDSARADGFFPSPLGTRNSRLSNLAVLAGGVAALCGIAMSASAAVDRALYPTLRSTLEARLGGFALDAAGVPAADPVVVEGRLRYDARPSANGASLRLAVERVFVGPCPEPVAGDVALNVTGGLVAEQLTAWTAGRTLRMPALLRRPSTYRNDGLGDQERALALRGITLVGSVKSAALVTMVAPAARWQEWAARARQRTREVITRHLGGRDPTAAAVAIAVLIGDRAGLDPETERRLQEAGTYHVIAISGGNVAIVGGLVLATCALLGWRGGGATGLAIAVLAAYALIVEGGASVFRATAVAILYLAVRLLDLRTPPMNALALAAGGLLLLDPLTLLDVGFWLTFGASAALLAVATLPIVMPRSLPGWGSRLLLASLAVDLVLLPVGTLVFERVTVAGLALNLLAIPSLTLLQVSAMGLVLLDLCGLDAAARWCGWLAIQSAHALLGSARLVDLAPWVTWRVPPPPLWLAGAYLLSLGGWWAIRAMGAARPIWGRGLAIASATLGLAIATSPQTLARNLGDGRLHLTMFDVGQGDAMLVTFPNGKRMTVDAGGLGGDGSFDIGDRVLGPALRARGVRQLDYLAVTHADADHIGGAQALLRDFVPTEVWAGIPVANQAPTETLRQEADRLRVSWRTLQRGDMLEIAGVRVHLLHPPPPDWERQKVRNDDSLVLTLAWRRVTLVLTGDIGREVEAQLSAEPSPASGRVLLKAPHHGSNTSSSESFLQWLTPSLVLVGVGRGNMFGHPSPPVLARYQSIGAPVFRTDHDGQIDVHTDGVGFEVETFSGRRVSIR